MSLIENLNSRNGVKAYNPTKKISDEDLNKILEAARLSPTSSGLQPFRIIVVKNQTLKEKMIEGAFNHEIMRDCSHILVFAAWGSYTDEKIDNIYKDNADIRNLMPRGRFLRYTDLIKKNYRIKTPAQLFSYTSRQSYIALALAMAQAAELKIDSTPSEGFNNEKVDEILNLKEYGLKSVTLLLLGYKDETDDLISNLKEVRIPIEDFIIYK